MAPRSTPSSPSSLLTMRGLKGVSCWSRASNGSRSSSRSPPIPPPITTASGSSTAVTAAMTRARRSASCSTAARAGATPRRAASKTCRAESREDIPSSTAAWTTPRAETLSSNDPHRVPETGGRGGGLIAEGQVRDLARRAAQAHLELAVDDDAHSQAGADHQVDEVVEAGAPPAAQLAQRRQVRVVRHRGPIPELTAQGVEKSRPAPAAESRREEQGPVPRVEDPGAAHHRPGHLGPADPGTASHSTSQGAHHPDQVGCAARRVPDVTTGHDGATEVGHRAAQPAMPDIDADHMAVAWEVLEDERRAAPLLAARADGAHQPRPFQDDQDGPHRRGGQAGLLRQPWPRGRPALTEALEDRPFVQASHRLWLFRPGARLVAARWEASPRDRLTAAGPRRSSRAWRRPPASLARLRWPVPTIGPQFAITLTGAGDQPLFGSSDRPFGS